MNAAPVLCGIARDGGIGDGDVAGGKLIVNTAAVIRYGITCYAGIQDGKRASIEDTSTAKCTRNGIPGDDGIGNGEGARVIKGAAIVRSLSTRNSHTRNGEVATRSDVENSKVTAGVAVITTDDKRRSTRPRDG